MSGIPDQWAAGSSYEEFMGRWSRRLATDFVAWLRIPPATHWLDVGCGTGALAAAIANHARPQSVIGCDPAVPLVDYARNHSHHPALSFAVAGVGNLPRRPEGYGSVTSLLALNFFPDPAAAIREMRTVASPGGTVSACVWDYENGMQFLRRFWDAAVDEDPSAAPLDEANRFPLCRREPLTALFADASLNEVRCDPIEIPTPFTTFDDFWRPFLGGTGPAPSYVASLEPDGRTRLERRLREALRPGPDRAIALTARAWAVRGRVS